MAEPSGFVLAGWNACSSHHFGIQTSHEVVAGFVTGVALACYSSGRPVNHVIQISVHSGTVGRNKHQP